MPTDDQKTTERPHIVNGQFQSDKYPTCPPGKVPLSVKDPMAQDLLWEYARRRRAVDVEFSADLEWALAQAGFSVVEGAETIDALEWANMTEDSKRTTEEVIDTQLIDATAGLLRVLRPGQEARLSQEQLSQLLTLARRAIGAASGVTRSGSAPKDERIALVPRRAIIGLARRTRTDDRHSEDERPPRLPVGSVSLGRQ